MAELTTEQKAEIRSYLHEQRKSDALAPSQKWEVAKIVGGLIVAFTALLGLGGAYLVTESADKAARSWAVSDLAAQVISDESFRKRVDQSIPIPSGMVAAFDIEADCPVGWVPFEDGFGRVLVGAGGKEGGPTSRSFRQVGGKAEHILKTEQVPAHKHNGVTGVSSGTALANTGDEFSMIYGEFGSIQQSVPSARRIAVSNNEPRHQHPISTAYGNPDGSTEPITNMPPYIALHFCKYGQEKTE